MEKQKIRIASFDIGKKNFAQYIEDVDVEKLLELENKYKSLPKKMQRRVKGDMTDEMRDIIKGVYLSGKRIQTGVYDLRDDTDSDKLDIKTRNNTICHLEKYTYIWDTCDIFIIEQQFFKTWGRRGKKSGGSEANVDAIKLAEGVLFWFLNEYPTRTIEYFGSQNKTQILGAPWKMSKPQRKKWAENEARHIYVIREDVEMIDLFDLRDRIFRKRINTEKKIKEYTDTYPPEHSSECRELAEKVVRYRQKLDDIGDACVQCQAYKYRNMIACF